MVNILFPKPKSNIQSWCQITIVMTLLRTEESDVWGACFLYQMSFCLSTLMIYTSYKLQGQFHSDHIKGHSDTAMSFEVFKKNFNDFFFRHK